jgi:[acyl-carrier-protein] S-malonyltransferase
MLSEAAGSYPVVQTTFTEASDALGYDLWSLVSEDPQERLGLTEFTQPAILTASVALYRAFVAEHTISPVAAAGHSLGEYSALVAAGVLSLADGAKLVSKRGAAMQKAVPVGEGGMAVVLGLEDAVVSQVCDDISTSDAFVGGVNFNAPGQVVIAGEAKAVASAVSCVKRGGCQTGHAVTGFGSFSYAPDAASCSGHGRRI